jgi:hypothetical protein
MEENKVATDSSAPNVPEVTRLSGEQAEERTAREPMTKHTDSSRSTDSGVCGNAQTSAPEIRRSK